MNAEAEPRVVLDSAPRASSATLEAATTPSLDSGTSGPDGRRRRISLPGDGLSRVTFGVLFVGTLLLAWKLHMFKLPSQIAADRAAAGGKTAGRTTLLEAALDWVTPWRWGRGDMLKPSLATGGDMGAHVWSSDYLRRSLLSKGRLTGWSNDWLGGFPVLNFYFPLPTLVIGFLGFIIPANIAFKVVTAFGILALPTTAWLSGRVARLPRPIPLFLGLAAFPFVLSRHFDLYIYGGNLGSTMAGEFSFAISVAFGVLFLGLFVRVLTTGEYRGRAALCLAATGLCHLLPTIWVLCTSVLILVTHLRPDRLRARNAQLLLTIVAAGTALGAIVWLTVDHKYGLVIVGATLFGLALADQFRNLFGLRQLRDALLVLGTGGALAGFWLIPFAHNLPYTNDMGWEKMKLYEKNLFPFWGPKPYPDSHIAAIAMILALIAAISAVVSLGRAIAESAESRIGLPAPTLAGAALVAAAIGLAIGLVQGEPTVGLILGGALFAITFAAALLFDGPIIGKLAAGIAAVSTVAFLFVAGITPGHLIVMTGAWALVVCIVAGVRGLEFERLGIALLLTACLCVAFFVQTPEFRLWNARVLPFWFLTIYLLAAHGAFRAARAVRSGLSLVADLRPGSGRAPIYGALSASALVFVGVGLPLNLVPNGLPIPKVSKGLLGVQYARDTNDSNFSPGWALYNYRGYQGAPGWNEYKALMDKAVDVGRGNGCGRVLYEYEDAKLGSFGTTLSPMLLPYWTKGCLQSFEGVYFESSATMPWHWMTAALVTTPLTNNADGSKLYSGPSNPQRNIPYPTYDLVRGVEKMKASGVRYYLSITAASRAASDSMPDKLRKVGEVGKCPSPTFTPDPIKDATSCFTFYEVIGSQLVSSLTELPQVVKGIDQDQYGGWLDVETEWYNNPTAFPETIAWSGPKDWNRFTAKVDKPKVSPGKDANGRDRKPEPVRTFGTGVTTSNIAAAKPVEPVTVSNISLNNTDLRFTVDRVGVPVLVKVSYFPNWSVSGAKGPYRVMPNFMVVIPTSKNVHLHYGYSGADALGYTASFAGVAMLGLLHRTRRRPLLTKPEPPVAGEPPLDESDIQTQSLSDDTGSVDVPDSSDDALRRIVDELPEDNEHLAKDE
jgi:hypothetical protein